ncbi:fumarylacetoacetate hydrolase family protein [Sphingomonas bacterium]|uniref:fumarylacetoacetate hydrolase family protein n=1 Tax=Sphingomonas bacterium TaxID=1895847 RepID=UPI001576876B|nr:fumarylacetoacetate hydrolase family protein [Sphingomonas bacterium]
MKLASFSHAGRRSIGRVEGEAVVDLAAALGVDTIEALLALGDTGMDRARTATGSALALADVVLHAPVSRPPKFFAIAANYQSHIDEVLAYNSSYVPPVFQRWFAKMPSCINDPFAPILMPPEITDLDYEAELAIVIGRRARRVTAHDAPSIVAGYTVCNDVSARDWQKRSPTIMLGKSFDSHGPLGPWLVTPDEVGDPRTLRVTCTVNGEIRQDGSTAEMIHDCWDQIAYLSTVCTLEPGDIIATGTPKGTGAGLKPPRLLNLGDVVRCEVERVGAIEATVVAEAV